MFSDKSVAKNSRILLRGLAGLSLGFDHFPLVFITHYLILSEPNLWSKILWGITRMFKNVGWGQLNIRLLTADGKGKLRFPLSPCLVK